MSRGTNGHPAFAASRTDALMTMTSMPFILIATVVLAFLPRATMPIAFTAAAVLIADVSCREKRAGARLRRIQRNRDARRAGDLPVVGDRCGRGRRSVSSRGPAAQLVMDSQHDRRHMIS